MPSEERVDRVLEALATPLASFRSAAAQAADEARAVLARWSVGEGDGAARVARELGAFAVERLDPARFATLFEHEQAPDPAGKAALERAAAVLNDVAASEGSAHRAAVSLGGDLHAAALSALARLGRAFGAARVIELVRSGRYRPAEHEIWLTAFKPARWNRVERRLAPPLVLEVDGADLRAATLAEFLDGAQKIVLVVGGGAPPAALVRLVTPGVLVMQTPDPEELARLSTTDGPAVAALVPESAARFIHDPAAGSTVSERLTVISLPAQGPRVAVGRISASQQAEELSQLVALAALPSVAPAAVPADPAEGLPPADPADRLAAWLLSRADLHGAAANGGES